MLGVLRELENFENVPRNENVPRYENVSRCLRKTCSKIKDLEFHSRSKINGIWVSNQILNFG